MQSIEQYPDYDDENFKETFMRDLYCKLNKQCFTIMTCAKKLTNLQLEAKNCNWRDFKRWIEQSKYQRKSCWPSQRTKSHLDTRSQSKILRNVNFKSIQRTTSLTTLIIELIILTIPTRKRTPVLQILNTQPHQPFCYYCDFRRKFSILHAKSR